MAKSIQHNFFFPQPPSAVWEYLTNSELLELWLMKNNFEPVPGHEFQFRTNPIPGFQFDGVCHCKVLELVPFKKLSYSWKGGPGNGIINFDTVVTWKLEEKNGGTELFLDHSGFAEEANVAIYKGMTDGWLKNVDKIANLLNAADHVTTNT
jgi:uncharacterized protein YndB with AHSA1/START domain